MQIQDEFDFLEDEVKKKSIFDNKIVKAVSGWLIQIAIVLGIAALVAIGFCHSISMQEGSMEPTLNAGETFLIDQVSYRISKPKRGDIIAFKTSSDKNASVHIKRIIGMPSERIQIVDGQIIINGETYMEKRDLPTITNGGLADTEITLGTDEYFVLGDNRNNSEDSRFGDVGNIKESNIVGKLWMTIAPFDQIGFIKN